MKRTLLVVTVFGVSAIGCSSKDTGNADATVGQDTGDDDDGGMTSGNQPTTTDPIQDGDDSTGTGGTGMEDDTTGGGPGGGGEFIVPQDNGGIANECDQWIQDCPRGEKCMPWANDGGSAWNATRCSPLSPNPGQIGDDCMVEGSGVSGIDSCDLGSMCYYVDPETAVGVCVGFCLGTPDAPQCDPGYLCSISNNGVLTLCRIMCDPLLQDCQSTGNNSACLPAAGADGFVCIVDASGEGGAPGDPCEYLNSCDPGMFCAGAQAVPNCAGSQGCCTEFCDLTEPDPNSQCSAAGSGAGCEPWFEEGQAPPSLDHVGACIIPQ